ncbi:hypothetical protein PAEPH01_0372 [Pancytospora epiphaga]|nr:hypothetical protein PAEPH01_0372 [Pancytospora epiphaga]
MGILDIKLAIEKIAPKDGAAPWDNTGILIDELEESKSKSILLCIDMTEKVVDECIRKGFSYIISYHPIIFTGIKSLCDRRLLKCVRNGISVYCPHTQLDTLMNEYILKIIGSNLSVDEVIKILKDHTGLTTFRIVRGDAPVTNIVVGVGSAFKNVDVNNTLIVTGEMSHHEMLNCKARGNTVIIMEHSNSERVYLPELRRIMIEDGAFESYRIEISEEDKDPVDYS